MTIPRREFLKRSALGVGSALAGLAVPRAAEPKPGNLDPYEPVALGKLGFEKVE